MILRWTVQLTGLLKPNFSYCRRILLLVAFNRDDFMITVGPYDLPSGNWYIWKFDSAVSHKRAQSGVRSGICTLYVVRDICVTWNSNLIQITFVQFAFIRKTLNQNESEGIAAMICSVLQHQTNEWICSRNTTILSSQRITFLELETNTTEQKHVNRCIYSLCRRVKIGHRFSKQLPTYQIREKLRTTNRDETSDGRV